MAVIKSNDCQPEVYRLLREYIFMSVSESADILPGLSPSLPPSLSLSLSLSLSFSSSRERAYTRPFYKRANAFARADRFQLPDVIKAKQIAALWVARKRNFSTVPIPF